MMASGNGSLLVGFVDDKFVMKMQGLSGDGVNIFVGVHPLLVIDLLLGCTPLHLPVQLKFIFGQLASEGPGRGLDTLLSCQMSW